MIKKQKSQIESQSEEIERRQFVEKKVQTYVKTLIDQNSKCKQFIQDQVQDQTAKAKFLQSLQSAHVVS